MAARCRAFRPRLTGNGLLLAFPLRQPRRHRAQVLSLEEFQESGHAIRPQRRELPRSSLHRRYRRLLVMSLEPNITVAFLL